MGDRVVIRYIISLEKERDIVLLSLCFAMGVLVVERISLFRVGWEMSLKVLTCVYFSADRKSVV